MKKCGLIVLVLFVLMVEVPASAKEDIQWVRVTVLLEPGSIGVYPVKDLVIPGGVYSLAETERRGQDAIDKEILDRIRFLGESKRGIEESMRLATLLPRQYYLPLKIGQDAVLPVIDLNPRLGIVITPLRLEVDRAVCQVRFLEPEGPEILPEFTGEPITLRLRDADIRDVLATFVMIADLDMIVDPVVEGTVTVDLRDVPWDQALDLILRVNGLGWVKEDDSLRVAPLEEISRHKRARTDVTINLPRGSWGSARIASQGDAVTPTAVLIIESVDRQPAMVAEREGFVRPTAVHVFSPTAEESERSVGEIVVFRGILTEDGRLHDAAVLRSPSAAFADRFSAALENWSFRAAFDEEGRRVEAVVGFGLNLWPTRGLASIRAVEHVGVEIKVGPPPPEYASDHPDSVIITAYVTDLDSGEIIGAPRIFAPKGDETKVRTGFVAPSGEPSKFEMKVYVSEDGRNVRCSWVITCDGRVVNSHKAEFEL